jgi:hypothetical protein
LRSMRTQTSAIITEIDPSRITAAVS